MILETSKLTHEEKVIVCALSKAANAAFVKTSTGFGGGGGGSVMAAHCLRGVESVVLFLTKVME